MTIAERGLAFSISSSYAVSRPQWERGTQAGATVVDFVRLGCGEAKLEQARITGLRGGRTVSGLLGRSAGAGEEGGQEGELNGSKGDFHPVGNHWVVILREEGFDDVGPDE